MRFLDILLGAAAVAPFRVLAAPAHDVGAPTPTPKQKRKSKFQFSGVNQSGAEFGNGAIPGQLNKDYTWPAKSTIDTLTGKGMNIFRIPMLMERAIPSQLTGSINETYFSGLTDASGEPCDKNLGVRDAKLMCGSQIVSYITGKGAYAVVDPHNFGRYYNNIISDTSGFQAWWGTVASRFATNDRVVFDTNNEYHDMDNALVGQLNQAAINGIRAAGANTQYIFVEGNSYSGAWTWVSSGTAAAVGALTDPAGTTATNSSLLVYQMHQYLDGDGSGTSPDCVSATVGQSRVEAATGWLRQTGRKGVLGETAGGANAVCVEAVTGMLRHMEDNSDAWLGWLWWGGGPWWGDYIFSMEPPSGTAYTGVLPSIAQFI